MIIDSSAILAIFFRETGADALLSALLEADFAGIGALTAARGTLRSHSLLRFPFTNLHWQRAIDAYFRFGKGRHPAALNLGDCMTYATAAMARQPLLCRGDDFRKTDLDLVELG